MSENWLFCWHPLYYVEEKSKKETAMWKGSKTIQDVIRRSRTLFWIFFYKLSHQHCEEATSCCAVSALVCGLWKGIEKEKEGGAENFNRPFWLVLNKKIKSTDIWWRNGAFQMIHDGFIYLATLMLLAAILVNLPVYLRGKGAQTFLSLHRRSFWSI